MTEISTQAEKFEADIEELRGIWKRTTKEELAPSQKTLETLAALCIVSNYSLRRGGYEKFLNPEDQARLSEIQSSRENHQFVAKLMTSLLKEHYPYPSRIEGFFNFFYDFDISFPHPSDLPYKGHYEGTLKANHPDFEELRKATQNYIDFFKSNPKVSRRTLIEIKLAITPFEEKIKLGPQNSWEKTVKL